MTQTLFLRFVIRLCCSGTIVSALPFFCVSRHSLSAVSIDSPSSSFRPPPLPLSHVLPCRLSRLSTPAHPRALSGAYHQYNDKNRLAHNIHAHNSQPFSRHRTPSHMASQQLARACADAERAGTFLLTHRHVRNDKRPGPLALSGMVVDVLRGAQCGASLCHQVDKRTTTAGCTRARVDIPQLYTVVRPPRGQTPGQAGYVVSSFAHSRRCSHEPRPRVRTWRAKVERVTLLVQVSRGLRHSYQSCDADHLVDAGSSGTWG